MALRFIDGFEHYAIPSQITLKWNGINNIAISSATGRRSGTKALLLGSASDYVSLTLDNQTTWIVGMALYIYGNETSDIVRFTDSADSVQATVVIGNDGTIRLYRGSSTLLASSTLSLNIGVWNYIEIKLTIADSGGLFEARVNETAWVTYTGDTKSSSTLATANKISLYGRGNDIAFDDVYICDTTGSANNDYLGDCRVDTILPNGVGNYTDFAALGSVTNWENVDETSIDSDTSYNYSNTVGAKDTFAFTNVPSITGTIFGVQANIAAKKDDAGSRVVRAVTRIGGADYESANLPLPSDYVFSRTLWQQNPAISAAWTEAAINGAEFGYKIQS